jgi:alpha-tubulin suppressor-like RCC1 family protein
LGNVPDVFLPTQITDFNNKNIIKISAGKSHVLAISSNGDLYVFGVNNDCQLGLSNVIEFYYLPYKHPYFSNNNIKIVDIETNSYASCLAIDSNNVLYGFGTKYFINI